MSSKPKDAIWTDDQWRAISERDSNLLVAAAAGSGKTAVLVERIIRRITDPVSPTDVDRLLVATFTKAAADEMRHRIRDALEKQLAKHKGDEHLSRQLALLNKAAITTLHSFCLEIVQTNFHAIPIDPVFRIAHETEAELLKNESIEELFEHEYAQPDNEAFLRLIDSFGGERNDEAVVRLVLRLYEFSRSHPWPEHWLHETVQRFRCTESAPPELFDELLSEAVRELSACEALLHQALSLCHQAAGPAPYEETVQSDLQQLALVLEAGARKSWNLMKERLEQFQFARLKPCRGDAYDPALVEAAKGLRNDAKDKISKLRDEMFLRSEEQYTAELSALYPVVEVLVRLTGDFAARYTKKKQDKGLVDFNDLEHYALAVLRDKSSSPERLVPSEVARAYRARFTEVLLDEYQDTNRVQEMIVELISRDGKGNRFMVGDVKQSIYRFRLAEPDLFLSKYKAYAAGAGGVRIDLSQNFRSRSEVVDGVNFLFRQIMHERVAEITYDEAAELKFGATYYGTADMPEDQARSASPESALSEAAAAREALRSDTHSFDGAEQSDTYAVELLAADRNELDSLGQATGSLAGEDGEEAESPDDTAELEAAQLEARMIGLKILELTGKTGKPPLPVYDKSSGAYRPPTFRDIVILLRATQSWAPVMIEQLKEMGIPAYADLNAGYFAATEVEVMMSLLKVVDNPLQDIPLAGVLRSPIFRFTAEELAVIRIQSPRSGFYDALLHVADGSEHVDSVKRNETEDRMNSQKALVSDQLRAKVRAFLAQLDSWRTEARQGSLADLIWRMYRETGYYDLVGGLPGGMQRQANLRALYDRARSYEATSFRGLFRFLRFIERMKESGADLGTARALGEQEDVVRIMTIHKSKGLEFPIVFVAGLSKTFNEQDLRQSFLLHKELGLGPKFIDPERRVSLPSLAWLAVRRRLKAEMLAEEMRILYVALTRAREKLILVTTFRNLEKQTDKWHRQASGASERLSDYTVLQARSYADWIFPALMRHPQTNGFAAWGGKAEGLTTLPDRSKWRLQLVPVESLMQVTAAAETRTADDLQAWIDSPRSAEEEQATDAVSKRFTWQYPHREASAFLSKITVTEIKRLTELRRFADETFDDGTSVDLLQNSSRPRIELTERPLFMEADKLTAAERGTAYHTVMQHVPLGQEVSEQFIAALLSRLVDNELLTEAQAASVDAQQIAGFFQSELGRRMAQAKRIFREQPFSYRLPAGEVYPEADRNAGEESMLIQGVIDCLFQEADGLVLVDYKTDALRGQNAERAAEKYDIQIGLYARAVADIWRLPVKEAYLYFFDGAHLVSRNTLLD